MSPMAIENMGAKLETGKDVPSSMQTVPLFLFTYFLNSEVQEIDHVFDSYSASILPLLWRKLGCGGRETNHTNDNKNAL
jgi:hypothetical protein